jgi:putative thioredoxin
MISDVGESEFTELVVERSRQRPVIVDFWAEWCGPCRQLSPGLEAAVKERAGEVELAKVDVDANPALAAAFGVQGIPAVKAFRDGAVVAEFTGAIPPPRIEAFLDELLPSEADRLAEADDESSLRRALELDPRNAVAATKLGRLLLARGETGPALELLEPLAGDFLAEGLVARAKLEAGNGAGDDAAREQLGQAFDAWDEGDRATALERLQELLAAEADPDRRDLIRRVMVAMFTELGADDPLAREHRRRLAAALH